MNKHFKQWLNGGVDSIYPELKPMPAVREFVKHKLIEFCVDFKNRHFANYPMECKDEVDVIAFRFWRGVERLIIYRIIYPYSFAKIKTQKSEA